MTSRSQESADHTQIHHTRKSWIFIKPVASDKTASKKAVYRVTRDLADGAGTTSASTNKLSTIHVDTTQRKLVSHTDDITDGAIVMAPSTYLTLCLRPLSLLSKG